MIIKDILKDTTAIICGRMDKNENNLEKIGGMIEYNRSVLESCHSIVLVFNRGDDVKESEMTQLLEMFRQNFSNCYLLQPHPVGLGHQIGHVALDKTGYLFAKNNLKTKYTMKLCNDILVSEKFLNKQIELADVYFLPAVATHEMSSKFDFAKSQTFSSEDYLDSPCTYQTWFFIASNNTDVLYESDEEIERVFRMWDVENDTRQSKVLCAEHSLAKWSVKNKLKRFSLYTPKEFDNYCKFVLSNGIYDGSLKNVMLESLGISHYHFSKQPILVCNL